MVSIVGLNKADVLAALYNASKPLGMGFMQYEQKPMTREEAEGYLKQVQYFDYLKGRVMKISLKSDVEFDERLYDRDVGQGAAQLVIDALRHTGMASNQASELLHRVGIMEAAADAREMIGRKTTEEAEGGVVTFHLGLSDAAGDLGPKIDEAMAEIGDPVG